MLHCQEDSQQQLLWVSQWFCFWPLRVTRISNQNGVPCPVQVDIKKLTCGNSVWISRRKGIKANQDSHGFNWTKSRCRGGGPGVSCDLVLSFLTLPEMNPTFVPDLPPLWHHSDLVQGLAVIRVDALRSVVGHKWKEKYNYKLLWRMRIQKDRTNLIWIFFCNSY